MILGMDFGTTNTGVARFDGANIRLLPIDPASPDPHICRSAIYLTRAGDYFLGQTALNTYFEQNIGRPTRYRKVWIGEVLHVYAELPFFYEDVYVFEDEFSPGRLFTSIKTALRNREYHGTVFQGDWYTPSDLVAVFLLGLKMRLDTLLGAPVGDVVLGRPVHFSLDPQEDQIAQGRLLDAAFKAGFEKVHLEYEPVAAALAYERQLNQKELVLVFDFGGGTLDFTVMEVDGRGPRDRSRQVLATGGLPVAGDIFDQRLFRVTVPKHLGEGDDFIAGGKRFPIPTHIFDSLTTPSEVLTLNLPHNQEVLQSIHQGSVHKWKTQALLRMVSSNYALMMFDQVERVKCQLSRQNEATLFIEGQDFAFEEPVSRQRFERAIRREYEQIRSELLATLDRSGLRPAQIDHVIRTGGSSQIPLFVQLLNDLFTPDKVRAIDVFSSVTAGLAIRAHQIAGGTAESTAYSPDSPQRATEQARGRENGAAPEIDLALVKLRLAVRQEMSGGQARLPEQAWVLVNPAEVRVLEGDLPPAGERVLPFLLSHLTAHSQLGLARLDDQALLATDQFKWISVAVKDLYLAQRTSPAGIDHALPLAAEENVTALAIWRTDRLEGPYLGMVTTSGQGRTFDAALMVENLRQKPFFQLDKRYSGLPLRLFMAQEDSWILVGTNFGRVARASAPELSVTPYDLLKTRRGEVVTAVQVIKPGEPVMALSERGEWLALEPEAIPVGGPPAGRGQLLRRNFSFAAFFSRAAEPPVVVGITSQGRLCYPALPDGHLSKPAVRLLPGEKILFFLPAQELEVS
jgi:hypothetical chaperone protein